MELKDILTIISMIMSIPAIIVAIKSLKTCKKIECELCNKEEDKIEDFNEDEYLYSMDFNIKLDGIIQPMLHKNSNEHILLSIMDILYREDPKVQKINKDKVRHFAKDILKNYTNRYPGIDISVESEFKLPPDLSRTRLDDYGINEGESDTNIIDEDYKPDTLETNKKISEEIGESYKNVNNSVDITNVLNDFYK